MFIDSCGHIGCRSIDASASAITDAAANTHPGAASATAVQFNTPTS
jgi:hypothetical protein